MMMMVMMMIINIHSLNVFDQSVLKQGPRTDEVGGEGELGQHGHGSDEVMIIMIILYSLLFDQVLFRIGVSRHGPRTDEVGGEGELGQQGHGSDDDDSTDYSVCIRSVCVEARATHG
jgi:hypothetical protein